MLNFPGLHRAADDIRAEAPRSQWGVWCTVSGGVTGARADWLKEDGQRRAFETEEAAREEAARCAARISYFSRASFSYSARKLA